MYKYGDKSNRGSGFTTSSGSICFEYAEDTASAATPAPMVLMNCRLVLWYVPIFNLSFINYGLQAFAKFIAGLTIIIISESAILIHHFHKPQINTNKHGLNTGSYLVLAGMILSIV